VWLRSVAEHKEHKASKANVACQTSFGPEDEEEPSEILEGGSQAHQVIVCWRSAASSYMHGEESCGAFV